MSLTTSAHWMYNPGGAFYDHEIDNSLRFNDNDSAYLVRTPASNGTRTTWTLSFWVKRCELGTNNFIFSSGSSTSNYFVLGFNSDDRLVSEEVVSGANNWLKRSSNVYRDVSGWYHVVFVIDTNNGTTSDRVRMYVNNERITSFVTDINPGSGTGTHWNGTTAHDIGRSGSSGLGYYDGYLSEINFIDGTALDPTSFGETKSGIWIPKEYSGSYGTNGFHLEFAGNANDTSGNGNNFTSYNISSYDYMPDTPTNSFCTMNILDDNFSTPRFSYSQGNLKYNYGYTGAGFDRVFGTHMIVPGDTNKYYMEFTGNVTNEQMQWGVVATDSSTYSPSDRTGGLSGNDGINMLRWVSYGPAPYLRIIDGNGDNAISTTNGNATNGDIFSIMYDAGAGKFYGWLNGVEFVGQSYASGTSLWKTLDTTKTYAVCMYQGDGGVSTKGGNCTANFGQDSSFAGAKTAQGNTDANGIGDFYYTVPTDALALCSANLPDPAIDPAADDTPEDYFDTVLYTAASSNGTYNIGNASFVPDFTWIKNRDNVEEHYLFDVVRGNSSITNKFLNSNSTDAEGAGGVSGTTVTSQLGGMEVVESSINSGELYFNSRTYAMWNWKAGGTGVSNTDGSITSTVSANPDAGFSVVTYTGNSTNDATIGHGLGVAPKVVIVKNRVASTYWYVYHDSLPPNAATYNLYLNTTDSQQADNVLRSTNSTTFTVSSSSSANGSSMVAYCFAEKEGYSKFGSYIGNGSSDGPFIYTGFRPAWVMIKNTNSTGGSGQHWQIADNKRDTYNLVDTNLLAENVAAEGHTWSAKDYLSNGFKIRTTNYATNYSGDTYIYLAFAEQPFKYANAR